MKFWKEGTQINFSRHFFQIADLLYVFIAGPMEIVQLIASQFVNSGACKLAEYSRVLSGVASILNLLAVTTERYIYDSLFINRYLKKKNYRDFFKGLLLLYFQWDHGPFAQWQTVEDL